MKQKIILKLTVAIALLFAGNLGANAQFGGLRGLVKEAKKAVTDKTDNAVNSSTESSSGISSEVSKVTAGPAPEVPWTMTRDGQNRVMQYIEKMENASTQEVIQLRDQMIKRYLYNEANEHVDGYQENQYFAMFLNNLFNQNGLYNPLNVKIINGSFDFEANGNVELWVNGASAFLTINEQGEAYFISATNHDRTFLEGNSFEAAKNCLKRVENYRAFFAAAGKGLSKDMEDTFEQNYNRATMYTVFMQDAIKNNSPENIERRPMPKAGSMNGQLNAAALSISKQQDSNTVSVIITRNEWDVKRNALGVPICRVVYGYRIVQTNQGKRAVSCSWAQDHQGGGNYGALRHYGVGTESFYVE
ncbi:MAG: hypothetical protein J6U14_10370 [Bacteroidaceae bacterium]|nr:hypothetical protein [Bacteroidaceae bacterium]